MTNTCSVLQGARNGTPKTEVRNPELVRCFRHDGEYCARCDGSGFRPRVYCAGCEGPSGRPNQGGKTLMGTPGTSSREQRFWCLDCHPLFLGWVRPAMLERMSG